MAAKPLVQCFSDDINAAVNRYREEGLTFAEAVGALEIAKLTLADEMLCEEDEKDDRPWERG